MDSTTYELLAPDVITASKATARTWPGVIEEGDAHQLIWERIISAGQSTLDKLVGMDRPLRISSLTEIGHQVAAKERDDYEAFSGNYHYSTEYVRRILDADMLVFEGDRPDSLTFTEWLDLTDAFARLQRRNARYAFLLTEKYIHGVKFDNDGPDRKAANRAVDSLTVEMNRVHTSRVLNYTEGPGTRKVISNSQAAAATNRGWND